MELLDLSFCFWNYDRTRPIVDGRVSIEGICPRVSILSPEEAFARAFTTAEFDVTELSFSNYMSAVSEGHSPYVAIPVFPSRTFRHGSILVRSDRGIDRPQDLRGRSLGLQEYQMTAALVVRGMLRDEYGIEPSDITWHVGDVERPTGRTYDVPVRPGVTILTAPAERLLVDMLVAGEIDGLITLRPPASLLSGSAQVRRLFADWRAAEQTYYRRTGIFPIMHTVGVRRTLAERNERLVLALYDAFLEAKRIAIEELAVTQAPKITLPWVAAELEATRALMGEDIWPYGIASNRRVLETLIRYSFEEGLILRPLSLEELFAAPLLDT